VSDFDRPLLGMRVLDRLLADGKISAAEHERVKLHGRRGGERMEDAVVSSGVMSEAELLRFLAAMYRTRFVSTEKLRRAKVNRQALAYLPRMAADRLKVFPLIFDGRHQALTVVAADLESRDVAKQVQMVSDVHEVHVYVARPACIEALIRKHYYGEAQAFDTIPLGTTGISLWEEGDAQARPDADLGDLDSRLGTFETTSAPRSARSSDRAGAPSSRAPGRPASVRPPPSFMIDDPALAASLAGMSSAAAPGEPSWTTYVETVGVLMALLEQDRGDLRGHSALVCRLCRKLAERLELTEAQREPILVAAQIHDLGKAGVYHLTPLNVFQYEGHRARAQKTYLAPLRLLDSAHLPVGTHETLTHMYERYDGRGFPDRKKGKEIPLGARVLAVAETYADLTTHDKNPYRKRLAPTEACDAMEHYSERFFDPTTLALLRRLVVGDELQHELLADRKKVLLVDPDLEDSTVLEMRLSERGFDVVIARDADSALAKAASGGFDGAILEVELSGRDGFALFEPLREALGSAAPILFLTGKSDDQSVRRGFGLGAVDYLVKPASPEVVAAKLRQAIEASRGRAGGVSGSLTQMALPDVIQILGSGRKSGRLELNAAGRRGELYFVEGSIHHATFGPVQGAEAVYAMLLLDHGDFRLDPSSETPQRSIEMSTEGLLLEGMRRMDEARR